jgi:E3 ubiquitin-protein ligase HERC4
VRFEKLIKLELGRMMFVFGRNNYGQLGLNDKNNRNIPTELKFFSGKKIKQIQCGEYHSMALCGEM